MPEIRSPQLQNLGMDSPAFSPLKVMKSGAGYYVGTSYTDSTYGEEPGSRDSGYFGTPEEAQVWLDDLAERIEKAAEGQEIEAPEGLRMHP